MCALDVEWINLGDLTRFNVYKLNGACEFDRENLKKTMIVQNIFLVSL